MNKNVNSAIQVALSKIGLMVANTSKELAPYQTGNLRRSISVDFMNVQKGFVVVGSPEPYARRREFENYKNPDRKYYIMRGYTTNETKIKDIINQAFNDNLK